MGYRLPSRNLVGPNTRSNSRFLRIWKASWQDVAKLYSHPRLSSLVSNEEPCTLSPISKTVGFLVSMVFLLSSRVIGSESHRPIEKT